MAVARWGEELDSDFRALRGYSCYAKRSRYESAFIENNLCGQLPIRIGKGAKDEPEFRFRVMDGKKEERVYHLIQTVVRRVREANETTGKHEPAKQAKPAAKPNAKWRCIQFRQRTT